MILAADTAITYACFDTETENMMAGAETVKFIAFVFCFRILLAFD